MKIKVSKASGPVLDWMVARCEGGYDLQLRSTYGAKKAWQYTMLDEDEPERMDKFYLSDTAYSTNWNLAGPIIEREGISIVGFDPDPKQWNAHQYGIYLVENGPTPLIAAMRCFCVSKLGEEIEVPDELI